MLPLHTPKGSGELGWAHRQGQCSAPDFNATWDCHGCCQRQGTSHVDFLLSSTENGGPGLIVVVPAPFNVGYSHTHHKLSTLAKALLRLCIQRRKPKQRQIGGQELNLFKASVFYLLILRFPVNLIFRIYLARQFSASHASLGRPPTHCFLLCKWTVLAATSQETGGD